MAARTTGLQTYVFLFSLLLGAAREQLSPGELEALHQIAINILADQVAARREREAA